jgi:Subtilase family/D-alanyl-D-alanine carboxypeptidase
LEPALLELYAEGSADDEVAVILRLESPLVVPVGVRIIARFGDIATCRLRRGDIPSIRQQAQVKSMKAARAYQPTLSDGDGADEMDEGPVTPGSSDQRRPEGALPSGEGVVVAHIDWGLDFAHPDFRHPDGQTRIDALWDQSAPYDPEQPNDFGYGRIYYAAQINAALRRPDPYVALKYDPAASDTRAGSHGTHTTDISAGNGRAGGPVGIAPRAAIAFVHLSTTTAEGPSLLGDSVAFLEALDFFARVAGERSLVVNASLGRQAGPKDGLTLTERGMDAFLLAAAGRAIVQSTGNYFDRGAHSTGLVPSGQRRELHLDVEGAPPQEIDIWYAGVDRFMIGLSGPEGVEPIQLGPGAQATVLAGGREVGRLYHRLHDPNNGDNEVTLFLRRDAPVGPWIITLQGDSVLNGRFHAWVERTTSPTRERTQFEQSERDATTTLGTICTGFRTLAVGAYDAHQEERPLARFSSSGPTRDFRELKPELVAPGVRILAARSRPRHFEGELPLLTRMSGTSMAAPHVTGAVALMFAAAGHKLSVDEVRSLLLASTDAPPQDAARSDRLRLGNGYLNIAAAVEAARLAKPLTIAAVEAEMSALESTTPSPAESEASEFEASEFEADTSFGRVLWEGEHDLDAVAAEAEQALTEADSRDDARMRRAAQRGDRPRSSSQALPFQFQVPLTGGAPALAMPIGGAASPLALTLPLAGAPAPATPAPAALGAPAAVAPVSADPAAELPPVVVAMVDAPPAAGSPPGDAPPAAGSPPGDAIGESMEALEIPQELSWRSDWLPELLAPSPLAQVVDTAGIGAVPAAANASAPDTALELSPTLLAALAGPSGGSGAALRSLLNALSGTDAAAPFAAPDPCGHAASATALFNQFVRPRERASSCTVQRAFGEHFRALARPGESLHGARPEAGDLVVRVARGENWGSLAVIASAQMFRREELADAQLRGEGQPRPPQGYYLHVVEPGATPSDRLARRVSDITNAVLPDTLLLRLKTRPKASAASMAAEDDPGDAPTAVSAASTSSERPLLRMGSRGQAVATLQRKLNAAHARQVSGGARGLAEAPLLEDGTFGSKTRSAVLSLQGLAFPDLPREWDGVVGVHTWAAVEHFASSPAPQPHVPPGPTPPGPAPAGAVEAGREVVQALPLLQAHRGTPPDLILRWNAMTTKPDALDVVVHLHGFSSRREAMRLDSDKERSCGLDFANPDAPGESGRVAPTLAILPRGNFYGGGTGIGYDFPALLAANGLRQLIDQSLARFAARIGVSSIAQRRLILTAHSGGGAALMRLVGSYDPDEVQLFDATYTDASPLILWLTKRLASSGASSAMRVLYRPHSQTEAQAQRIAHALAALIAADTSGLRKRFRVEATPVAHDDIPRRFGWRFLRDAGADVPLSGAVPPAPDVPPVPEPPAPSGPSTPEVPPPAPTAPGALAQSDVDRLHAITFGNAAEITAFFAGTGSANFSDWFNTHVGGRTPFVRPSGGGALRMPVSPEALQRFNRFWDCIQLAYDQPRISALEFASLICIVLNETDGDFATRTESSGRNHAGRSDAHGPHPGLAYFFDTIELRPGRRKASYNRLSGGRTAASLFDDDVFVRAHGARGGAARLAHHGSEFGGAWASELYPQDAFSVDESAVETEFIRQTDFYKFRGRGVIQTTGRSGYLPFVRFVSGYAGSDPVLLDRKQRWTSLSAADAATASTNEDWDAIFGAADTLARAVALHADPSHSTPAGSGANDYRFMSRNAATLEHVPPPPASGRVPAGQKGSVFFMGRRISGSYAYGAGEYRERVFALLGAILRVAPGALPAPAPSPSPAPSPAPAPHPTPSPTPESGDLRAQWDAHPRAQGYFSHNFARYVELAPLYAAHGIPDAAAYLDTNMVTLTFFGHRQDGHRDLVTPLRQAEEAMRGQSVLPAISSFGCLNPRPIRGTSNRLSNHALGRAIDLNPASNPRITQASDFLVISAVVAADLMTETRPEVLSQHSRSFQSGFTEAWAASQTRPDVLAALSDRSTRGRLDSYARTGFCTLFLPLIQALLAAGLGWGGAYRSSKDFMHFELPGQR